MDAARRVEPRARNEAGTAQRRQRQARRARFVAILVAGAAPGILLAPNRAAALESKPGSGLRSVSSPPLRLAQRWEDLSPSQRSQALQNFQRYQRLPESQRSRIDRGFESWKTLEPDERDRIRHNYDRYRQMTPDQRRGFGEQYQRWKGKQR